MRPLDEIHSNGFGAALAKTDEQGRFSFSLVTAGSWWLGPTPRGDVWKSPVNDDVPPFLRRVVVPERVERVSFDLHVTRGLHVRGRVVDPEGLGVGAWVELARGMSTRTDDEGRFELGPLEPGEYALDVRHAKGLVLPQPVHARAGAEHVEIRLERPGRILGRVIDADTNGPVRAAIHAFRQREEGDPRWFQRIESSPEGTFDLGVVGRRTYCVQAHTADGRIAWKADLAVEPGEHVPLELVLQPGATLRVSHDGDPSLRFVRVRIDGVPIASAELDPGEVSRLVVPALPLEVTFEDGAGTRWQFAAVPDRPGAQLELSFPRR